MLKVIIKMSFSNKINNVLLNFSALVSVFLKLDCSTMPKINANTRPGVCYYNSKLHWFDLLYNKSKTNWKPTTKPQHLDICGLLWTAVVVLQLITAKSFYHVTDEIILASPLS